MPLTRFLMLLALVLVMAGLTVAVAYALGAGVGLPGAALLAAVLGVALLGRVPGWKK